ncbi:MAG TPA: ABC transporter permease [Candidatus Acidoferrales bacterium]|jgi:predicted permease|nr:ABC transporter permease [Candidatus Acidoferrales bacterium]
MALIARLRKLWKREKLGRELDDELRAHVEMRAADNAAAGMQESDARYDALKRFGNVTLMKERTREMDLVGWIETVGQDMRFAARMLWKNPGFTAIAVVTLALGIGANTAMYTVVESVMVRALPYAHSTRMVSIVRGDANNSGNTSYLNYRDVRDQTKVMDEVGCFLVDAGVVQGKDGSVSIAMSRVTPNVFKILGVQPTLGRTFTEEEGRVGGPQSVLLSEGMWKDNFGADPQIVGRTVRVNNQSRIVVGVMPGSFRFPDMEGADVLKGIWVPMQPTPEMEKERGFNLFSMMGELKPGASVAQARAELGMIVKQIQSADPKHAADLKLYMKPYQEALTGPLNSVFLALSVALGLVLLIGCANVANLLIARCVGRQQEFAVRAALGASRMRLMRQLIIEGGLLSVLGCLGGFGLVYETIGLMHKMPPDTIPRADEIAVRWTVVLALAAIATATTVISSLLPALLAGRTDPQRALQAAARSTGTRSAKGRLSRGLVAGEVALSVVLLVATGLLFHTLLNLERARLGFETTNVSSFTAMPADAAGFANLGESADEKPSPSVAVLIYQPALARIRALPGVQEAALISALPLSGVDLGADFEVEGRPKDPANKPGARFVAVSGGYERVMGTPVIRGRMINEDDSASAPAVAAINETLAKTYFANEDTIGKQLDLAGGETGLGKPVTIVGVIGDQVDDSISGKPRPMVMLSYQQIPSNSVYYAALIKTAVFFVVKTEGNIAVAPAMRGVFHGVAPDMALDNFETLQKTVDDSNFSARLGLYLIGAFAGLAVLMVVAGLYGVLAQLVNYRRREIGLRMALGASPQNILSMVLRQGSVLVVAGLVVGLGLSVLAGKLLSGFLYQVKPLDPWTYLGVAVLLLVVGSVAALLPARRAAAVEPMQALREE